MNEDHRTATGEPILQADELTCSAVAGSGRPDLFRNLHLTLGVGEIVDMVGASGVGKSSLLLALAQLNPRADATLRLHGHSSQEFSFQEWRRRVSYVPQTSTLIGASVAEAIRVPWTLKIRHDEQNSMPDDESLEDALEQVGCADVELSRSPAELSGGQSARVSLLRSLLTKPDVLLADEVYAALDDDSAALVSHMIADAANHGMAVLRIRHRDSDGLAARTLTLDSGGLH